MKATSKFLALLLLILVLPLMASAESRYLSKAYPFSASGDLKIPLTVNFTENSETPIIATIGPLLGNKKLLSLEINKGNETFLLQLNNSLGYVLYKEKTRDDKHEELIVVGYTELARNRYQLEEIKIIGIDKNDRLSSLKVDDFESLELIRAPLQRTKNGELILALSAYRSGKTTLRIDWQEKSFSYQCFIK